MIHLTRRERFNAAHRLYKKEWDEEKNFEYFGKCANPNWHGHNYELFVTVKAKINPEIGFVVNLKTLSNIIKVQIIEKLDHKNINLEVELMKGKVTTTENIAIGIWDELLPHIKNLGAELHCIKIQETENNYVEYYGN